MLGLVSKAQLNRVFLSQEMILDSQLYYIIILILSIFAERERVKETWL